MCHILVLDFEMMLWSRIVNSTLILHCMKEDNILSKASSPLRRVKNYLTEITPRVLLETEEPTDSSQVPWSPAWPTSVRILSMILGIYLMDNKSVVMQTLCECSRLKQCWNVHWKETWGRFTNRKKSQYGLSTFKIIYSRDNTRVGAKD